MKFLKKIFSKEREQDSFCSAVIVAAGSSSRMGGQDKILHSLGDIPVVVRSILPFEQSDFVQEIIVVAREDSIAEIAELCKSYDMTKVVKIVAGGSNRMQSVQNGLLEASREADLIAIHDGARPFVLEDIIRDTIMCAKKTGACIPALPVKDTIKHVEDGVVKETPKRHYLFAAQTPQVFEANLIRVAIEKAIKKNDEITDDCSAVEQLGYYVSVVDGSEENIKLTTQNDLLLADHMIARREW